MRTQGVGDGTDCKRIYKQRPQDGEDEIPVPAPGWHGGAIDIGQTTRADHTQMTEVATRFPDDDMMPYGRHQKKEIEVATTMALWGHVYWNNPILANYCRYCGCGSTQIMSRMSSTCPLKTRTSTCEIASTRTYSGLEATSP